MLSDQAFSSTNIKPIVRDLFEPKAYIYWIDFFISITIGWTAFYFLVTSPLYWVKGISYLVAVFALYRSLIFTHELAHLKKGTFNTFRWVWNFLCGFPIQLPSFMYHGVHNDHHIKEMYGTYSDGEYSPFGAKGPWEIYKFLLIVLVTPVLLLFRYIVIAPVSLFIPQVRKFAWERGSSLTIDINYKRGPIKDHQKLSFYLQEFFTSVYSWTALLLVIYNILPVSIFLYWYLVTVLVSYINALRTLAAHRYRNPGNESMDFTTQFLDSVNVPGNPMITPLWAPIGLRYHGLHHLFPTMPYHSLNKAHLRIIKEINSTSPYWKTVEPTLWSALKQLFSDAKKAKLKIQENSRI